MIDDLRVLGQKPSAFDPQTLEFIFTIDRSFVDGPIQLETAHVIDAVIAADFLVKTESSVEDRMIFCYWFHIANLNVLAFGS